MMDILEIKTEYFKLRDKYFEKRKAFYDAKRKLNQKQIDIKQIENVIELSEEYGFSKAIFKEFSYRFKHLIVVES